MSNRAVTIRINGKEVEDSIKSIRREARLLVAALDNMERGSDEYNKTASELARVNGILREHGRLARGLADDHRKNKQSVDLLGGSLKSMGAAAVAAFSVGTVIQYGRELFRTASAMELQSVKARTVLGPALAEVEAQARKHAAAMGLTEQQYVDNTAKIADLLVPMGFMREEAARLSNGVVQLSGALSEWSGGQFTAAEASESVSKALLGSREELNRYGIDVKQSEVNTRIAEKGMASLTGQALKQAEAMATLELITEKSADAQTAFADGAGTMARRSAEMTARFQELKEQMATLLIPVFERLIGIGAGVVTAIGAIVDQIEKVSDPVKAANKAFEDQQLKVQGLEQELPKLVGRYEELVEKSDKTNDEQAELFKVIADIAAIVPSAVTEFDQYGVALGINTEKTKEYVEAQKLLLQQRNQDQIDANQRELDQVNFQIKRIRALGDQTTVAINKDFGERVVKVSAETLLARNEELKALTAQAQNLQNAIAILRGEFDGGSPAPPPPTPTTNPTGPTDEELEKAKKQREREAKERADALQRLEDQEAAHRQRLFEAGLEDDERVLERIRQSYRDQIELALELEEDGVTKAKDLRLKLEALKESELATAREGFRLRDAAEQEKRQDEALASFAQFQQRQNELMISAEQKRQSLLQELAALDGTASGFGESLDPEAQLQAQIEAALAAANEQYNALRNAAMLHNQEVTFLGQGLSIDLEEIERRRQEKLLQIQREGGEESKRLSKDIAAAKLQTEAQALQQLGAAFGQVANSVAAETERGLAFKRAASLAEIAFSSASAIAGATSSAAALPFPANLAAIATAIATVLANLSRARQVLSTAEVPQYFDGGLTGSMHNVRGDKDGRMYTARYMGRGKTGMLNRPVILAADHGPEYLVANHHLRNPKVLDHVMAIDAITGGGRNGRMSGSVAQYNEGGITAAPSGGDSSTNALLVNVMMQLLAKMDQPAIAVVGDDAVVDLDKRRRVLASAARGRIG